MSDSSSGSPETGWLIERGQSEHQSPTMWWCGGTEWSDDAAKAVRFARRVDAERVVAAESSYVGDPIGRVTEHTWILDFISAVHQDFKNGIPVPSDPSSPVPAPEDTLTVPEDVLRELRDAAENWSESRKVLEGWKAIALKLGAEVSRLRSQVERMKADREEIRCALEDCGIGGIFDIFDSPADAITQMAAYIQEREPGWQGLSSDNSGENTKPEEAS